MIYVGSAESEAYDQVLDTIYVGPVPEGRHIFVFQADPPDVTRIPEQDAVGVTIVLLTCSYRGQEFVRVGYFINNDYADPELKELPPAKPQFDKLTRNILASKPRVTRFKINWDDAGGATANGMIEDDGGEMKDGGGGEDEAAAAVALHQSTDFFDQQAAVAAAHQSSMDAAMGGMIEHSFDGVMNGNSMSMPADGRMNENSNSLAMEC